MSLARVSAVLVVLLSVIASVIPSSNADLVWSLPSTISSVALAVVFGGIVFCTLLIGHLGMLQAMESRGRSPGKRARNIHLVSMAVAAAGLLISVTFSTILTWLFVVTPALVLDFSMGLSVSFGEEDIRG